MRPTPRGNTSRPNQRRPIRGPFKNTRQRFREKWGARVARRRKWWESLTPAQQRRVKQRRVLKVGIGAVVLGAVASFFGLRGRPEISVVLPTYRIEMRDGGKRAVLIDPNTDEVKGVVNRKAQELDKEFEKRSREINLQTERENASANAALRITTPEGFLFLSKEESLLGIRQLLEKEKRNFDDLQYDLNTPSWKAGQDKGAMDSLLNTPGTIVEVEMSGVDPNGPLSTYVLVEDVLGMAHQTYPYPRDANGNQLKAPNGKTGMVWPIKKLEIEYSKKKGDYPNFQISIKNLYAPGVPWQ